MGYLLAFIGGALAGLGLGYAGTRRYRLLLSRAMKELVFHRDTPGSASRVRELMASFYKLRSWF